MTPFRPTPSAGRPGCALAVLLITLLARDAASQAAPPPTPPSAATSIALFRIEALGLDPERALRLETLFRFELERLAGSPLPSKGQVERAVAKEPALRGCTGEPACLSGIGKKLGVGLVVAGNVGELGDSYVINLKLVDVASGQEIRSVQESLRGSPDELIEAVRVAAYRLVAPERLYGSIAILSDVDGAQVFLDGRSAGKTPIARSLGKLALGAHQLRITAPGYTDFLSEVEVRFQKTTQVVVRMVVAIDPATPGGPVAGLRPRHAKVPWYASTWGYVGIGLGAVAVGLLVGALFTPDNRPVDCDVSPATCGGGTP